MKINHGFALATLMLLLNACTHTYYQVPQVQQTLLFREKNETRMHSSICIPSKSNRVGISFQGAYAVSKHIGVTASYMRDGFYNKNLSGGWYPGIGWGVYETASQRWAYTQYELGAGYFTPLNRHFVFETYGGFGLAAIKDIKKYYRLFEDDPVQGRSRLRYQQYYIQPAIGFTSPYVDISLSTRLMLRRLGYIRNSEFVQPPDLEEINTLSSRPASLFIEPAFTIRAGIAKAKLQFQVIRSLACQSEVYRREKTMFSIGVVGLIGHRD